MTWQFVTGANLVIALAYLAIAGIVLLGLTRTGQLTSNKLGFVMGLIFLSCGVHHGSHAVHMLLPTFGIDDPHAYAMREAWHWPTAVWDVASAVVAVYYLSLRRLYTGLLANVSMFEDLRARERQALEINDNIVQGLVRVKWALEADRRDEATTAADYALADAQRMVTDLLMAQTADRALQAGRLRRESPAGA